MRSTILIVLFRHVRPLTFRSREASNSELMQQQLADIRPESQEHGDGDVSIITSMGMLKGFGEGSYQRNR